MAPHIDLVDHLSYAGSQPHEAFDWLRENDPVHWHEEPDGAGFWAITRYDLVAEVGKSPERFSSAPTIMMRDPTQSNQFGDHKMMLTVDPPVHTRMRRFVSSPFVPKAVRALETKIDGLAARIIDEVAPRGECDLVTDIAGIMPSHVIAEMLGIPLDDGCALYHHTETIHSSTEVVGVDAQRAAFHEMLAYSQKVYAEKKADPADDLASMLAHGVIADQPVDEIDFFLWFLLLVDAGGDTTRNLVGGGMQALFEHPAVLDELRADPDGLLNGAVEELLRFVSPVIYMRRTATADTELGGQRIAEGDKVMIFYGAANRDPAVFDDPHRLDIHRSPNPHVAFGGGGPHFCLGAHLARLEIRSLLRETLTRLPDLEPTAEPTWMTSNFIYGPTSMPVRFTAAG